MFNSGDYGYTNRVDIWSVGCVAFQLLTKKKVWDGLGKIDIVSFSMKMAFKELKPKIPLNLKKNEIAFLSSCLERDADKRASGDDLLSHDLFKILSDIKIKVP